MNITPVPVLKAVAILKPEPNHNVTGNVVFEQQPAPDGPVTVILDIKGLDKNAKRGFHVHQWGDLTNGCDSAGPHFNPYGKDHGGPSDDERHVGDLGNIQSDEKGNAKYSFKDTVISLHGANSIIGRAIVIHEGTDDLGRGGDDESRKTGNSGPRAACGVIGLAEPPQ